jgi:UPF0755 protein
VKKNKSFIRRFLGLLSGFVIAALVLGLGAAVFLISMNAPPRTAGPVHPAYGDVSMLPSSFDRGITFEYDGLSEFPKSVLIQIREGESSYAAGSRLERAGLIRNRYLWNLLSRLDGAFLKAGTYRINLPVTTTGLRSALVEGQQILLSVTIPEGVTLKKAAVILEKAGVCSAAGFLSAASDPALLADYRVPALTMEGYLYPETYFFPGAYPAEKVVRAMADMFFTKLREIGGASLPEDPEELNRIVIIASIVEREYRVPEEAAVMAGVFYNRLKINMALQSCATVEYIITDIQGKPHPKVLYNEDIEIRHPYNTYIIPGLPPGPISLPGRTALDAALHPVDTGYLYFRLINEASGRHYFSRTLDDHISAGQLFVKGY